ncbi:hypothetical protein [Tepidimicrobium xylanilyticum]
MAKSNFIVRGGADFSGIKNEIDKTEKNLKGFAGRINNTLSGISQGLGINLGKLTKVGLIAAATKKLVDFGKQAIEVASDLTEVQNVVDVTFGAMAADINEFASNATKQFGLSELSAKQFASTMGAMLKSSGITGEAVKDMSIELTKLAADMASFYNLDPEEAFAKIRSGISGETEPLKQLGINMNVANLQAYAMSQGINKAWKEMTQAEQTMLRYNYLLSVTSDAQGDFARNAGTWANQVKLLKEQWQEFMSLIGKALIEVLLPVVKFLNKVLEILIGITKAIGKIYTMITGREIGASAEVVETNMDIEDSALGAADGQEKLADGIGKAAKAARKALAPFDELNILQQNLASGGSGGLGGGVIPTTSQINTKIDTRQVDDGIEETKRKWEGFFIWFGDWWNRLKQAFAIPIYVPAPIFAAIPDPIYEPNWGLELPPIEKPVFQPIPNPVYEPVWNLIPPPVPAVDYSQYATSLEKMKIKTAEITEGIRSLTVTGYEKMKEGAIGHTEKLRQGQSELWEKVRVDTETVTGKIQTGLSGAWSTVETNFKTHKENIGKIAGEISTTLVGNINQGLSTIGANFNKTIETVQTNLQTFGKNVATSAAETARTFTNNLSEGFKATVSNFATFANSVGRNLQTFGSGFLKASAETARGFVDNMVSGFSTVWNNFKDLMSSLGERVSGWFRENKSMVIKTTIAAGVVIGGVGLALAAPTAIPYVAGALGGLASIPALAEGGITNGPTLAMIGDNPGGREVVSPLDDLLGMITTAVSENGGSGDIHLTIKIGEDTITEKVISNINRQNRIAGATVIRV